MDAPDHVHGVNVSESQLAACRLRAPRSHVHLMAAERLGFTTMSLYRYVASKTELEFAMADEVGKPLLKALRKAVRDKPAPLAVHDAAL